MPRLAHHWFADRQNGVVIAKYGTEAQKNRFLPGAGQAASLAAPAAHQTQGAMGMTYEYRLQHLTRSLWSWWQEHGSVRTWSGLLGREFHAAGARRLYEAIAGPTAGR